jgi:hypothetical protein
MALFACFGLEGRISNIMDCLIVADSFQSDTGWMTLEIDPTVKIGTHYIDILEGVAVERTNMSINVNDLEIIANGTDEAIISGIPAGVQVEWPDGQTDIVTDGEIRFSVDLAGFYTFRFTAVPYLDQEVVIEAIPAT